MVSTSRHEDEYFDAKVNDRHPDYGEEPSELKEAPTMVKRRSGRYPWGDRREPDCEKCKYEYEGPEDMPCQECGMFGQNFFEPKEEKKMDNRKTKAQLMEELEQKNTEIAALKKELERSEDYELFVAAGKEMRDGMDGLVAGGLTEEQAFQVLLAGAQLAARRRI